MGLMVRRRTAIGREAGQAQVEFALVFPALFLLMAGIWLGSMALVRGALSGWGVFLAGTATGAFPEPAVQALEAIPFPDIRGSVSWGHRVMERQTRAHVGVSWSRPWVFGITLAENWRGEGWFRLWRFYPGRPRSPWD